jgi:hypothetical protein
LTNQSSRVVRIYRFSISGAFIQSTTYLKKRGAEFAPGPRKNCAIKSDRVFLLFRDQVTWDF